MVNLPDASEVVALADPFTTMETPASFSLSLLETVPVIVWAFVKAENVSVNKMENSRILQTGLYTRVNFFFHISNKFLRLAPLIKIKNVRWKIALLV